MELRKGAETLSKLERLRNSRDFSRIFREGEKVRLPGLRVRWVYNGLQWSRVGTSVGRRFGNAVKRNRVRRIIKELYRKNKRSFPVGIDMVFLPGRSFINQGREYQIREFAEAARRISSRYRYLERTGSSTDRRDEA